MESFYYRDEHHVEYAPTTRSHLQKLLLTKQISDLGEVRREGSEEWLPILAVIRLSKGTPAPVPLSRSRAKWKNKLSSFMGMMKDPSNVNLVAGFALLLVLPAIIYLEPKDKPETTRESDLLNRPSPQPTNYGLPIATRKYVFYMAFSFAMQANLEAGTRFPLVATDAALFRDSARKQNEEKDRIEKELIQKFAREQGITPEIVFEITIEGLDNKWPRPSWPSSH